MKIIGTIDKYESINSLLSICDGLMCGNNEFSLGNKRVFSLGQIKEIIKICRKENKLFILKINTMLFDKDYQNLKSFILEFMDFDILFYVSDIGVFQLLEEVGLSDKVIYDPVTMITNYEDYKIYVDLGIDACSLSHEIPLKDVILINEKIPNKLFYTIFGYFLMFFSRRKLLTLYSEYKKIDLSGNKYLIKEETRDVFYPIIEDQNGTYIYRDYIVSLSKEIDKLNKFKYAYIDSIFIDETNYLEILKTFNDYNQGKINKTDLNEIIDRLNLNIKDGFTFNDTIYNKEEF